MYIRTGVCKPAVLLHSGRLSTAPTPLGCHDTFRINCSKSRADCGFFWWHRKCKHSMVLRGGFQVADLCKSKTMEALGVSLFLDGLGIIQTLRHLVAPHAALLVMGSSLLFMENTNIKNDSFLLLYLCEPVECRLQLPIYLISYLCVS